MKETKPILIVEAPRFTKEEELAELRRVAYGSPISKEYFAIFVVSDYDRYKFYVLNPRQGVEKCKHKWSISRAICKKCKAINYEFIEEELKMLVKERV